jgi:hypothetical protein
MADAGFKLSEIEGRGIQPGNWYRTASIEGIQMDVGVDLFVPDAADRGSRRRGARLPHHGNRAARRVVGLEAATVDNDQIVVAALDPADPRTITVKVAGFAALIVAKTHKIHDRLEQGDARRLSDKDASDIYRIMQEIPGTDLAVRLASLVDHPVAGEVTVDALRYFADLFGRPSSRGVQMAQSALYGAVNPYEIAELCVAFSRAIASNPTIASVVEDPRSSRSSDRS